MGCRVPLNSDYLLLVIILFEPILHETLTNSNFDTYTICQLSHGSSFDCHKLKSISQRNCFVDCFTDWHNILNEDVLLTLCLEQEYAGYYGVKTTLDGNPKIYLSLSEIGALNFGCIWGCISQEII